VLNKYVKLVVGYFVYQSARDTAQSIQSLGWSIADPEDDLTSLGYWRDKICG
jgi:hypothetical protein